MTNANLKISILKITKKTHSKNFTQGMMMKNFTTKSGKPITIGTGTGTKWQWAKKSNVTGTQFYQPIIDQVKLSIKNGFNHIDTAEMYTTCPEVGQAVKESGIKREDLWITTKYAPFIIRNRRAPDTLTIAFEQMLKDLQTDYVDALLIHSPFIDESFDYDLSSLWNELIGLYKTGKIRYIGVSNFSVAHIEIISKTGFKPSFNQIEFHPNLQNQSKGIVKYCQDNDIVVEAYNGLSSLFKFKDENLSNYINELSNKYDKADSQILLKWILQMGVLPITTSSNEDRIKQSLNLDFELEKLEIEKICGIGNQFKKQFFFSEEYKD